MTGIPKISNGSCGRLFFLLRIWYGRCHGISLSALFSMVFRFGVCTFLSLSMEMMARLVWMWNLEVSLYLDRS